MKHLKVFLLVALLSLIVFSSGTHAERTQPGLVKLQKIDDLMQSAQPVQEKFDIKAIQALTGQKSSATTRQGGEDIASATVISSIPTTLTGTTSGYNDDYEATGGGCTATNAPDVVYSLTPDADYRIHIISCNSSYWTKIFIYETDETTLFACNQYSDSCAPDYRAALYNLDVVTGITYYIVIDGGIGGPSGDYIVDIEVLPMPDIKYLHPALSYNGQNLYSFGYEYYEYDTVLNRSWSIDNGTSWDPGVGFPVLGNQNFYSAIDYWGNDTTFQSTWVGDNSYFDAQFIRHEMFNAADPSTWSLWLLNTNDLGWYDIRSVDISCDGDDEYWNWGFESVIASNDGSYNAGWECVNAPHIYYDYGPDNINVNWYPSIENCNTTHCTIDSSTKKAYAAYDWYDAALHQWTIIIMQRDALDWNDTGGWGGLFEFYFGDYTHAQYPAVASYGGHALFVVENFDSLSADDKDIVCWYTGGNPDLNHMSLSSFSVVAGTAEAERYPEVRHITGNSFVVTFIKNGQLYGVLTEDGGASWGTPEVISEVDDVVISEYRAVDIAESDGYAVKIVYEYEDTGKQGNVSLRFITYQAYPYPDGDGDGIPDHLDNCPTVYNDDQLDNDGDLHGDACDNCDFVYNPDQANDDADSLGNLCDNCPTADNDDQSNGDGDLHGDACDNCPQIANNDQANSDADSHGDACDNCPTADNEDQANSDADSHGDACDNCPNDDNEDQLNSDTDSHGDVCDNCPLVDNEDQADENQNGVGDACDWICGDANQDEAVNLLDITFLIAYKYMEGPPPEIEDACDVNSDGAVNLLDITYLIAYKYMEGPEPDCP